MKINFPSENSGGGGSKEPLDEGRYNFVISGAEFSTSPNKDTPQITLWTKVSEGSHKGKTRLMNFYLTEKALWKLQSLLQIVAPNLANGEIDTDDIVEYLASSDDLEFSAWVTVNTNGYNEFANFSQVTKEAASPKSSGSSDKYDDIPI